MRMSTEDARLLAADLEDAAREVTALRARPTPVTAGVDRAAVRLIVSKMVCKGVCLELGKCAICRARIEQGTDAILSLAATPQGPAAQDGFKLVPIEPTPEMLSAPLLASPATGIKYESRRDLRPSIYRAMLAAAPYPPGEASAATGREALERVYRWFLRECAEPDPTSGEVVEFSARAAFNDLCRALATTDPKAGEQESKPFAWLKLDPEGRPFEVTWSSTGADAWRDQGSRMVPVHLKGDAQ